MKLCETIKDHSATALHTPNATKDRPMKNSSKRPSRITVTVFCYRVTLIVCEHVKDKLPSPPLSTPLFLMHLQCLSHIYLILVVCRHLNPASSLDGLRTYKVRTVCQPTCQTLYQRTINIPSTYHQHKLRYGSVKTFYFPRYLI